MVLYVNGQDIAKLVLGAFDDARQGWSVAPRTIESRPEQFLEYISAFVAMHGEPTGIVVVRGPGSATALRTMLSIVNTWGFVKHIPLFGIEKPRDIADDTVLDGAISVAPLLMVTPVYENPAKITASNKDALGRVK